VNSRLQVESGGMGRVAALAICEALGTVSKTGV
jgi:hypothetical protein